MFNSHNLSNFTFLLTNNNQTFVSNWNQYFFSSIAILGSITSIINFSVFINSKLKDQIYTFYLATSVNDFFYCFILSFYVLSACGTICDDLRGKSIFTQIYYLYFGDYLTSSLALIGILIECFVSTQRLFIFLKSKFLQNLRPKYVLIFIITFGLLYYIPVIFVSKIKKIEGTENDYELVLSDFGASTIGSIIPLVLSTIRLILASIVLFFINMITLSYFKKQLEKKKKIVKTNNVFSSIQVENLATEMSNDQIAKNESKSVFKSDKSKETKAKMNVTLMVIMISVIYTIGTLPWAAYFGIRKLSISNDKILLDFLYIFAYES
ncbi:unnamed protein product [Brachionus calyciflorus]|uniref:G-protein coupled receptors family 1 profile domain-containing protein n=1 Tax=Brachionus calyciflorus TaxID=104777 RepID=A0A813TK46_9BILA|nr:unnamed protein product [Brachionus calyciflorus]